VPTLKIEFLERKYGDKQTVNCFSSKKEEGAPFYIDDKIIIHYVSAYSALL